MKIKTFFFSLLAIVLMCACKNEVADYQNAMKSVDVVVLENYLQDFPDAPVEHRDSVNMRLAEINSDHDDYYWFSEEEYVIEKYEAAEMYISKHPEGLHVADVKIYLKNAEEEYKQELKKIREAEYERKYGEYRDRLVNFKYDRGATWLVFEAPDFDGKGKGVYYGKNIFGSGYTQLTYEINKKGELIVTSGKTTDDFSGVSGIFIVNVYSDCLYIEKGGDSILYYRELITDSEYQDLLKKYNF